MNEAWLCLPGPHTLMGEANKWPYNHSVTGAVTRWRVQDRSPWRDILLLPLYPGIRMGWIKIGFLEEVTPEAVSALCELATAYLLNLILKLFAQWAVPFWSSFMSLNALNVFHVRDLCSGRLPPPSSLCPTSLCVLQTSAQMSMPPPHTSIFGPAKWGC